MMFVRFVMLIYTLSRTFSSHTLSTHPLLVSADDRTMKDRLDNNDYVGMIAVLAQQYATRHGYDYLQLAAISTVGLVNRVHQVHGSPPLP